MGVITKSDEPLIVYVPMSKSLLDEMREWSRPVQLRWADDHETMEVRDMRQPVLGVYITADDQLDMLPPPLDSGKPQS